jgi:hypothetical protein
MRSIDNFCTWSEDANQTNNGKPAIMKHTSALLLAFLSKSRINLADLKGQCP